MIYPKVQVFHGSREMWWDGWDLSKAVDVEIRRGGGGHLTSDQRSLGV